jgi:hypothetical protein
LSEFTSSVISDESAPGVGMVADGGGAGVAGREAFKVGHFAGRFRQGHLGPIQQITDFYRRIAQLYTS